MSESEPESICDQDRYSVAAEKVEKLLTIAQLMGCVVVAWVILIGIGLGALGFAGSVETIMFTAAMVPAALVTVWCWRNQVVPLRRQGRLIVGSDARRLAVRMLAVQAGAVSFVWFGPIAFRSVFSMLSQLSW